MGRSIETLSDHRGIREGAARRDVAGPATRRWPGLPGGAWWPYGAGSSASKLVAGEAAVARPTLRVEEADGRSPLGAPW